MYVNLTDLQEICYKKVEKISFLHRSGILARLRGTGHKVKSGGPARSCAGKNASPDVRTILAEAVLVRIKENAIIQFLISFPKKIHYRRKQGYHQNEKNQKSFFPGLHLIILINIIECPYRKRSV